MKVASVIKVPDRRYCYVVFCPVHGRVSEWRREDQDLALEEWYDHQWHRPPTVRQRIMAAIRRSRREA